MFFYILDAAIVVLTIFVGNSFLGIFNLSPTMNMISYVFLGLLGVWFCLRTPAHPVDRNINMMAYLLMRDKNRYHEITTTHYDSIGQSKTKKE